MEYPAHCTTPEMKSRWDKMTPGQRAYRMENGSRVSSFIRIKEGKRLAKSRENHKYWQETKSDPDYIAARKEKQVNRYQAKKKLQNSTAVVAPGPTSCDTDCAGE